MATAEREPKTALIFPGQGLPPSDIIACYSTLRAIEPDIVSKRFALVQEALDKFHGKGTFMIETALENKDSPYFEMTSFVQPIVYGLSRLASEIANTHDGIKSSPDFVAGHSLGEYSALTEADVFPFEEGIEIVTFRGLVVQVACKRPSSLVSISGLDEETVENLCQETGGQIALINGPKLMVVGIAKDQVPNISTLAEGLGARRVTPLSTAGAFHTSFMEEAASELDQFLPQYEFRDPQMPVVVNLTGEPSNSGHALRNHLVESLTNPVRWAKAIQTMADLGVGRFIEAGPGNSLAALNRINNIPEDQTVNILSSFSKN